MRPAQVRESPPQQGRQFHLAYQTAGLYICLTMARKVYRKRSIRAAREGLSLDATNLRILAAGLVVIGVGYFLLSRGPYDSFWSLTLAPIGLLSGYLIVIPYGILRQGKKRGTAEKGAKTDVGG